MDVLYRDATMEDVDFLVKSRLDFTEIASTDESYAIFRDNLYVYFEHAIKEKQCDIVLAEVETSVIGTGIIFYYNSVPSLFNPWGKNAYITSMYVDERYRRHGIASTILDKLVKTALIKDYYVFLLQETEIGKPLYEKYGFQEGRKGMILKL